MIYINLGFPKTSSTNIQKNFYPFINGLNYIGRYYHKPNIDIFNQLNNYIESRENFSKEKLDKLSENFYQIVKKNNVNLLSSENWIIPYQKNNFKNNIEIVSQFEKLKRLKNFMDNTKINYEFFIINRQKDILLKSLFATLEERIIKLFGYSSINFSEFLKKFNKKDDDYENMKLFFDIINLDKIEYILKKKVKIFDYETIKNDPKKFLFQFSEYLELKIDESLHEKLQIKTRVSETKNDKYLVNEPNIIFKFLKKIIPKKIKKLLEKYKLYNKFSVILNKKKIVDGDDDLKKIINEIYKK